ncbi:MAG: hypothetical protein VKK59_04300 [Vampirovibrionales bacterium]|nr:hypothetical protein [Vampirovibrionales bacterium]
MVTQKASHLLASLPITAKLNPMKLSNLGFLLSSAALVRVGVGVLRCATDWTNKDPQKSLWDKRSESWERILGGELTGTGLFLLMLYMGQDWMANRLQKIAEFSPKHFMGHLENLSQKEKAILSHAMEKGLGSLSREGLYARLLYEGFGFGKVEKILKATPEGTAILKKIAKPLSDYAIKIRMNGYSVFAAGAAASALFGGFLSQAINDGFFARMIIPNINKAMGLKNPYLEAKANDERQEKTLDTVTSQITSQLRFPAPPGLMRMQIPSGAPTTPTSIGLMKASSSPLSGSMLMQGGHA